MKTETDSHKSIKILRWIARILSLMIFLFVLLRIFLPDPSITEPVPLEDWFLLALWGVAVVGLMLAWKWERLGAIITITIMFVREIAWVILKGDWLVNFLIIWAVVIPPAVLYLVAWRMERRSIEGES